MNLLLDTHVLLWWLDDNRLLSAKARDAISEGTNPVFIICAARPFPSGRGYTALSEVFSFRKIASETISASVVLHTAE